MDYHEFLISKIPTIPQQGFTPETPCPEWFKPHQVDCSHWAIEKGRAALFESFGMGKTVQQLQIMRWVHERTGGKVLFVAPLGVRQEFTLNDGPRMGMNVIYCRTNAEVAAADSPYIITNYERVRDGGIDPAQFAGATLDEASCFVSGTLVSTPAGDFPIEDIQIGDQINNAFGIDTVAGVSKREVNSICKVVLSNGVMVKCSISHQFFTQRGWIEAADLTMHDEVIGHDEAMRMVQSGIQRQAISAEVLLSELQVSPCGESSTCESSKQQGTHKATANKDVRVVQKDLRSKMEQQELESILLSELFSVVENGTAGNTRFCTQSRGESKGCGKHQSMARRRHRNSDCSAGTMEAVHSPSEDGKVYSEDEIVPDYKRTSTEDSRWKRSGTDGATGEAITGTRNGLDSRTCCFARKTHSRLPDSLQDRHSKPIADDGSGDRREFTCNATEENGGCKEGRCTQRQRVDRIEILERGNSEYDRLCEGKDTVTVYDITVTNHPSFSVHGMLVHNCLRSYGSLTTQTFVDLFRDIPYRFVATATPSPNEFLELINYAHFLGVMDRGQALTRFFQRDSKKAGNLTLYPHMEEQFWLWVASWAVFVNRPSDLGYSDEGYDLPELQVTWHEVQADQGQPGEFRDSFGQALLFEKPGGGIKHVAKNRRKTKDQRIQKAADIIAASPDDNWIIWHYLESERAEIQKLIPDSVAVYGSQEIDDREQIVQDFSNGKITKLSSKPELLGSGCNFQRHCHKAIFIGPTDKFNDFIQAVHRIHRFLQKHGVELHIIYADTQYDTVVIMRNKWERHNELTLRMREIIKQHGLSGEALRMKFQRTLGTKRAEVTGKTYRAIHNDCVEELKNFDSDCIDEIVTSIPFSDHYEYSPSINDFGHNNGDEGFFKQFDFLVPELLRVLKPGRIAAIHTKDRIQYGKMTGHGMYTVNAFSDKTVQAFQKHGFLYMGRITIDTDVVRENAQSYRLGWSENAEDSTKMGCGSTEFVLLFRKWEPAYSPNSTANGPEPVKKDNSAYTRSHWQLQACGIWRSNGNELLSPAMIARMTMGDIMYWWKSYCEKNGYDYEKHVQFCQAVEDLGHLPSGHMLFPPSSNNPDIWTDILRINTLNTALSMKQEQSHVCPLQLDVIQRLIERFSNPGDTILDPFGGVHSVPYQAIKMGRKGIGIELNPEYWRMGVSFCERAEQKMMAPTLFDLELSEV